MKAPGRQAGRAGEALTLPGHHTRLRRAHAFTFPGVCQ